MGGREVRGDGMEGEVDKRGRGDRGSVVPYSEADAFYTHFRDYDYHNKSFIVYVLTPLWGSPCNLVLTPPTNWSPFISDLLSGCLFVEPDSRKRSERQNLWMPSKRPFASKGTDRTVLVVS